LTSTSNLADKYTGDNKVLTSVCMHTQAQTEFCEAWGHDRS